MSILSVTRFSIRLDKVPTWEVDLSRAAEQARKTEDPLKWQCSQLIGGEAGVYYIGGQSETVAEAAARDAPPVLLVRLFGEQEGMEILERTGACIQHAESQIMRDRPELSYPADEGMVPEALLITRAIVRPGHQAAAEELVRKIAEAVPKTGDARRFTVYQPLIGDLRAIGSVRPVAKLAELDHMQPPEELLVQAFGIGEGGLIYRTGSEALESLEAELAVPRPDLSNPAQ